MYIGLHVEYRLFLSDFSETWSFSTHFRETLKRQAGPVAQSVQRLPTGWTVRGSNPGGDEIFRACPDRSWGPSSLLYNGYRVFPGGKVRPGREADTSPPSNAEVKNGVELYLYSP